MKEGKKFIKKVIAFIIPSLLPLLGVVVIVTGLLSVVTLVLGLIAGFFGLNQKEVDISNYTLEQIVAVVDDTSIITEEMLDNMMIDRDSFKKLLKGVQKANTEFESREIKVQQKHEYLEVTKEEVKDADGNVILDKDGNPTYISSTQTKVDYDGYRTITVSNESKESAYKLHWQQLYVFAVMRSMAEYGEQEATGEVDGVNAEDLKQAAEDAEDEYEESKKGNEDNTSEEDATSNNEVDISKEDGTIVTTGLLSGFTGQFNPSTEWDDAFEDAARSNNLPVGLIKAVAWTESTFDPYAVSNAKPPAYGLMQLTQTGAGSKYTKEELFDPELSIKVGTNYLAQQIEKNNGDVVLGLTAYFWGPGNVEDFLENNSLSGNNLAYAAKVLNTYFGNIGLTGEKLLSGNYTLYINAKSGVGVYDEESGRLQLSSFDVNMLISDYKAKFIYSSDVVNDTKDTYTYDECKAMSGSYFNSNGGSANTEGGIYTWYVPCSELMQVMLPYEDIYFADTGTTYSINNARWYALLQTYWSSEYYDHDWFEQLVAALPRGQEAIDDYNYYISLASDEFKKSGEIAKVLDGASLGYYQPSTDNPYDAAEEYLDLGVDRKWHMTKSDLEIINMTDAEIWKVLTGKNFTRKPKPGEISEGEMYSRTTTITVPIWKWKNANGLKKKASKVTIRVNSALAYMFIHIFTDIYEDKSKPVIDTIGYYYFRPVKLPNGTYSKDSLSVHSFGAAIDINATSTVKVDGKEYTNWIKAGSAPVEPTYSEWVNLKDTQAKHELLYIDCPIVQIFKAYGFKWGHDYSSKKDGMHFSKVGDGTQSEGLNNHLRYYK